ncbi:MAG: efflux RND transporter periplasmic adaptor subunit [Gammaproteobacteria bacterium]|nr:efflux RND transporter periplasmic adaptor subunit [Gammaproteobacteria bacterium]
MRTRHLHKVLIGLVFLFSACEQKQPPPEPRLRPVKYVEIVDTSAARVRTFTGVSKSTQEARLSFKVAGTVQKFGIAVGDVLEPGQLIAELDPSTYELQAQQAQADLARAQAEERNAAANYKRVQGLYENDNASRNDLDSARAGAESARQQVTAARKAMDIARLSESYTRLEATDRCAVVSTSVEVGENISAGQEVLLVTCGDSLEVDVSVPGSVITAFRTGLSAVVRFDSIPNKNYQGVVTEVGIAATGGTTFPVTVGIPDTYNELRSGLAAQVSFQFSRARTDVYTVPSASVGEDQVGRFIYVVESAEQSGEGLIKRQVVEVGEFTSAGIELLSGVEPGDKVVTAGVSVIRDGMRVKLN